MAPFTITVWKTSDRLHLRDPGLQATAITFEFDPDEPCRVCREPVLNIAYSGPEICPWCDGGVNRPKMLAYQQQEIKRQLLASCQSDQCQPNGDQRCL